jgi:glycosyltransferase involved in cell wall biosynthesis
MTVSERPVVSVVMPVHNRFDIAKETVRSVLAQTHRPIELIVVDDASEAPWRPDGLEFDDGIALKIIRSEDNIGPGAARERGRKEATGQYICYLDSDDLWHPEKTARQVEVLSAHPGAGMCYCASRAFSHVPGDLGDGLHKDSGRAYEAFLPQLLYKRPWDTSAIMWTRDAVDRIGPFSDAWVWEDTEYEIRAGCKGIEIMHLPEVLCHYRTDYGGVQITKTGGTSKWLVGKATTYIRIADLMRTCEAADNYEIRHKAASDLLHLSKKMRRIGETDLSSACWQGMGEILTPGDAACWAVRFAGLLRLMNWHAAAERVAAKGFYPWRRYSQNLERFAG